ESDWKEILKSVKQNILKIRSNRIRPLRDDKVLTSWNALYITSLAYAGRIFSDDELIISAEKTYQFLFKNLIKDGRLLRSWREGKSLIKGYLNDYAELANAGVELYKSTFKVEYLNQAYNFTKDIIRLFDTEKGVYYSTGFDSEKLIRRSIDSLDSVEPSGNSTFSLVLQKLSLFGYNYSDLTSRAEKIFKYYKKDLETRPLSSPFLLKSYLYYLETKYEIILISKERDEFSNKIIHYFQTSHIPNLAFCFLLSSDFGEMKENIPFLQGKHPEDPYTLYICKETICEKPLFTKDSIISNLKDKFPLVGI
ncbi:MAG: thioredoxin domain-containing protein, partial [Spirochaetia bacterium]|nr:thioredoxin domain-containing protein [Spirochaetia bacterium]